MLVGRGFGGRERGRTLTAAVVDNAHFCERARTRLGRRV